MLALERHRRLLDLLNDQGGVRTAEAARELGVTEETVRRDFEKLEAEGALLRSHGGAVRIEMTRREFPARERARQQVDAKREIARAAVARIQPGQTILLDASTTVLPVAQLLPDQPLTVVTNALQVALALAEKPSIQVSVLGGTFISSSHSCVGLAAEQALDLMRIDTAYLSCRGFDAVRGPSEPTEENARLKRHIVERAGEFCLLADASKAEVSSSFYYARSSDVDLWITDHAPGPSMKDALASRNIRVEITSSGLP